MVDIEIYRGDTIEIELEITDENNQPVNITTYTLIFTIKIYYNDSDKKALIKKIITNHTDPVNGKTKIVLDSNDTNTLTGIFFYDIQLKSCNNENYTIKYGKIKIIPDITRE